MDRLPTGLMISGSAAVAPKVISADTVSLWSYRVWENSQYHLSISDLMAWLGSVGVCVGIVITLIKIIRVFNKD